ncbi:MAG: peptide chain release factor N(5)-glutamine methyltransferase [Pelobium sp.]
MILEKLEMSTLMDFTPIDKEVAFQNYLQQLQKHIPIQYVLEEAYFYGKLFKVSPAVLIPRPETEELVHLIIQEQKNKTIHILDIGTGSGCIPISLKINLPNATIDAIDISHDALTIAKENAFKLAVTVNFEQKDALNLKADEFPLYDVIVSNPPYIAEKEKLEMDKGVLDYEPHLALFVANENPLLFYDKISDFALSNLKKEGVLYFEINQSLGKETQELLYKKGFDAVIIKDINQNDRIIKAQLRG